MWPVCYGFLCLITLLLCSTGGPSQLSYNNSSNCLLSIGCSPSGTDCSRKHYPAWDPLLSVGCSFSQGMSVSCSVGSSTGCGWISLPLWISMRSGAQLPNNELQGNLSSIACSTSSLADIGICRVVSLTFFSLVTIKMLNFGGYRDRK